MPKSIIDPFSCGFAKVAAYTIYNGKLVSQKDQVAVKLEMFMNTFNNNENFIVDVKTFRRFKMIVPKVRMFLKNKSTVKENLFETFSVRKWKSLSRDEQKKHSIFNCQGCLRDFKTELALFETSKCQIANAKADKAGLTKIKEAYENTTNLITKNDKQFLDSYGVTFSNVLKDIFNKEEDKKTTDKQKEKVMFQQMAKSLENKWSETSVIRTFGSSKMSLNERQKQRLDKSYESSESSKKRMQLENNLRREGGLKANYNHIGKESSYTWKKTDCLQEVKNYKENQTINFADLARRFELHNSSGVLPNNSSQVMKELLKSNGIEVENFDYWSKKENVHPSETSRPRRQKLRLDDIGISIPSEETNAALSKKLSEDIASGKYNIGTPIVPQEFEKTTIVNGQLLKQTFSVCGRKIPLSIIREKTMEKHRTYMRIQSDDHYEKLNQEELIEEFKRIGTIIDVQPNTSIEDLREQLKTIQRSRHLMVWHDGSTLANHSHVLMMVAVCYDPAIFHTSKELFHKFGIKVNVQSVVEKPQLYILARCPCTDQQLMYTESRVEDLKNLETPLIFNGVPIKDCMRFFKGDGPAAQFEAGQQKGGNFKCWGCPLKIHNSHNFVFSRYLPVLSYNDRRMKVMETTRSKEKSEAGTTKLYTDIGRAELISELHERNIAFNTTFKTKHLQDLLKDTMHGIQRVPALLFLDPYKPLAEVSLQRYELVLCEPLHDVKNHIENLFHELPIHLDDQIKRNGLKDMLKAVFDGKVEKRAADYRLALAKVVQYCKLQIPENSITDIFESMLNIQQILYLSDEERSPDNVLRLHTYLFLHAMLLKEVVGTKTKSITTEKLYGKYYHALIHHSGFQYRIVSGRAINTEKEEATFNKIKSITNNTSNRWPEHVINNCFIRFQVMEERFPSEESTSMDSKISKCCKSLKPTSYEVLIPFHIIQRYPFDYQAFLENIADFLLLDDVWHESDFGVVIQKCKTTRTLHHFRSHTIKDERAYVDQCWNELVKRPSKIPANVIKANDGSRTTLSSLAFFDLVESIEAEKSDTPTVNEDPKEDTISSSLLANITNLDVANASIQGVCSFDYGIQCSSSSRAIDSTRIETSPIKTSTPIAKKRKIVKSLELEKKDDEATATLLPLDPPISDKKSGYSKSSLMLIELFGESNEITKYDRLRKECKNKKAMIDSILKQEYELIKAMLEVKLVNFKDTNRKLLSDIEIKMLKSKNTLTLIPGPNDTELFNCYTDYKRRLMLTNALLRDFSR